MTRAASAFAVALLVLLPGMAGCVADGAGPEDPSSGPPDHARSCSPFEVPPARGGDAYVYEAEGRFVDSFLGVFLDWRAIDPNSDRDNGPMRLPNGSRMEVHLAKEPATRLALKGVRKEALQATTWIDTPSYDPFPVRDTWIDPGTARVLEISDRAYRVVDGDVKHFTQLMVRNQPPLLWSPLLWNQTLRPGVSAQHTWLEFGGYWPWTTTEQVNWTVAGLERPAGEDRRCRATVDAEVQLSPWDGVWTFDATLRFDPGTPLPVEYVLRFPEDFGPGSGTRSPDAGTAFRMTLVSHSRGDGTWLDPFEGAGDRDGNWTTELAMAPREDGFLAREGEYFPTTYDEAIQAIRDDDEASTWLEDHPGAQPNYVEHTYGANGSDTIDEWMMEWADPNSSEGLDTIVTYRYRFPVGDLKERVVFTDENDDSRDPLNTELWVTLDELARVHQARYGKPMEVLSCDMDTGSCGYGTQESMHSFSDGSVGGGHPLQVNLTRGWVFQDSTFDLDVLAPPVG